MRKLYSLLAALCVTAAATAQTMNVYQGHVITTIPAASANDIVFGDGGATMTVMGNTFNTAEVDQIIVDQSEAATATLQVTYGEETWVTVSGDVAPMLSVTVNGGHVTVLADPALAEEVNYVLTGSSTAGSFYMDGEFKSTLTLNDVYLINPDSAAVWVENGKRINVVVPEGTTSTFIDGASAGLLQKAAFFINGHAEFSGAGTFNVQGNVRHAYASDEYTILGADFGAFNVLSSANDGIHVEQYFQMDGGYVSIEGVQGDGIDVSITKDATDEFNGQVFINGGNLKLNVVTDDTKGLKCDSAMTITGGYIDANVQGDGCKGFSVDTDLLISQAEGKTTYITMDVSGSTYAKDTVDESKCRGIKVKGNYTLAGGTISMNVTGSKAKGISIDGSYTYTGGTTNVVPE